MTPPIHVGLAQHPIKKGARGAVSHKTLACRRAIKFAAKTGLRKVVFEGDSTLVINAITQGWLDTFGGLRQKLIILF